MNKEIGLSGASGSGFNISGPDTYKPPAVLSKVKQNLNRTPVLYLRRKRNQNQPGSPSGKRNEATRHANFIWYVNPKFETYDEYTVDSGDIYPNHFGTGRQGQPEWVKFRDYKRTNTKWIQDN